MAFCKLRHRPHYCVFVWKRSHFTAFSHIVHAEMTENADKNGGFPQKPGVLKTHRFQKVPFLVWIRWKRGLLNKMSKIASYTAAFISVFGSFSADDRRKWLKNKFSNESELAWRDENKTKTLAWVWSKIFSFVLVETKTNSFKCDRGRLLLTVLTMIFLQSGPSPKKKF